MGDSLKPDPDFASPVQRPSVQGLTSDKSRPKPGRSSSQDMSMQDASMAQTFTVQVPCGILNPTGRFKLAWDFITFIFVLFHLLVIPVEIAFLSLDGGTDPILLWVDIVIGMFFLVDLAINCRTAYLTEEGKCEYGQKQILKHYCCRFPGWFWLDLMSTAPLVMTIMEAVSDDGKQGGALARTGKLSKLFKHLRFLKLLRLLRVMRLPKVLQHIFDFFYGRRKEGFFLKVAQHFILMCLLIHLMSCLWRATIDFPLHLEQVDLNFEGQDIGAYTASSVLSSYNFALWWVVTMLVTGEGMTIPVNDGERFLWACMGLISLVACNFSLAFLMELYVRVRKDETKEYEKICIAQRFSIKKELPWNIKLKMLSAIKERVSETQELTEFESEIIPLLSKELRDQIYASVYDPFLKRFPPFRDGDEESMEGFRHRLAASAQWEMYNTGEMIFQEGKDEDTMIFFLSGTACFKADSDPCSYHVGQGWWLGENACFWDPATEAKPTRTASVQALSACTLLHIRHTAFIDAVQACCPEDWLREQRNNNRQGVDGCQICHGDHDFKDCPDRFAIQTGNALKRSKAAEDLTEYETEMSQDRRKDRLKTGVSATDLIKLTETPKNGSVRFSSGACSITNFRDSVGSDPQQAQQEPSSRDTSGKKLGPMSPTSSAQSEVASPVPSATSSRHRLARATLNGLSADVATSKVSLDIVRAEIAKEFVLMNEKMDNFFAEIQGLAQSAPEKKLQELCSGTSSVGQRAVPTTGSADATQSIGGARESTRSISAGSARASVTSMDGGGGIRVDDRTAALDVEVAGRDTTQSVRSRKTIGGDPEPPAGPSPWCIGARDSTTQDWCCNRDRLPDSPRRYATAGAMETGLDRE